MNHTIFVLKKIPLGMLFLGNSFIWKVQYNRCSKVHIDCQLSQRLQVIHREPACW